MADIYSLAKEVLVWLGPEADNSTSALDTLRNMGNLVEVDFRANTMSPSSNAKYSDDFHWSDPMKPLFCGQNNPCRFIIFFEDHGSSDFKYSKR